MFGVNFEFFQGRHKLQVHGMSKTVALDEIPYCHDGCELFQRLREFPHPIFLDSSHPHAFGGRYDIMSARPIECDTPALYSGATEQQARAFFTDLSLFHRQHFQGVQPASQDIPFCGGLLGYIGYDAGNSLHGVAPQESNTYPSAILRAYDWCILQDHLLRRSVLVTQPGVSPAQRQDLLERFRRPASQNPHTFRLQGSFSSNMNQQAYREAFNRIQAYIRSGDCYQVNLAQCFSADCEGDPWQAYRRLRPIAAAPFAAYMDFPGNDALLCLSPERFISLHGHHVETSPIKGTRPRFSDPGADQLAAEELQRSEKDRAENLMIVDLLRNDLGRNCVPGSIHVDKLFEVQSFPTVHHLVSTISGELQSGRGAIELLRDSLPGGSITGAPKRRAMEIIAELESTGRQMYCGSVVYISADGRMDSNIAIRSLLCERGQIRCWAGGGIVADSQWQMEYQETYDKVGKFLALLEDAQKAS
jgi:para-aminobenzoate synthetase component 1